MEGKLTTVLSPQHHSRLTHHHQHYQSASIPMNTASASAVVVSSLTSSFGSAFATNGGSGSSSSKQVVNRLEVLPNNNQYGQHRLTPSTLVVRKVKAKMKNKLSTGLSKKESQPETSFALDDDPKKQSIPSFFPSTLRPRQVSAPSKSSRKGDDLTTSGSYTSRTKTVKSTPRQSVVVDELSEEEIQKKSKLIEQSGGVFEKQLECLLMDDDIYAARQSIKDAYLFKSYEREASRFSRKIELSQLGITLILHNKENFYNFYSRFKHSKMDGEESTSISDVTESKTEVDDSSSSPTSLEQPPMEETNDQISDHHLSIEPFITEDEKQQILDVLEHSGEPYLSELFKAKFQKDLKSLYSLYDPQSSSTRKR